jgi:hypothetical protein
MLEQRLQNRIVELVFCIDGRALGVLGDARVLDDQHHPVVLLALEKGVAMLLRVHGLERLLGRVIAARRNDSREKKT